MDEDDTLSDDAQLLILAALDGHQALADLAGYTPKPRPEPTKEDEPEPIGAFLKRITVEGFRGIGTKTQLDLDPNPSLTVVSGRNGSGKSSFAEALEVALTGTTYRWKDRTSQWSEHWRNIHAGTNPRIEVTLAEENVGPTALTVEWAPNADLEDATTAVQRNGQKKEGGFASLGWTQPLQTYRPLLTYEELGALLQGRPSDLYDAISTVLGLEQVTTALKALDEYRKRFTPLETKVKADKKAVTQDLGALDDERAAGATKLIKAKHVETEQLRQLATGTGGETATAARLRALQEIVFPAKAECDEKSAELTKAVAALAQVADRVGDGLQRREALIDAALAIHDHDGDQLCPLCGTGTLDTPRVEELRTERAQHKHDMAELQAARTAARNAQTRAVALLTVVPPVLSQDLPPQIATEATELGDAWATWAQVPAGRLEIAEHLKASGPVREKLAELQAAVDELIASADEAWGKVAARLAAFADDQEAWAAQESDATAAKGAHKWLKDNEIVLKNERVRPIAQEAKRIWAGLRQESNVEIAGLTLEGANTRRHVEIKAQVDGEDAGALSVMSQGELHSLALALFLPRATMPESPFRFVVLDDPVQAMDPAKVDGLVHELLRIAKTRQVIVFSHDDRFASAVRRAPKDVPVKIYEVTRATNSTVTLAVTFSPAKRYLNDAFALVKDEQLPVETLRRVLPGLLRLALEAQAREVFFGRELVKGTPHDDVEKAWGAAHKTRARLALALEDPAKIEVWLDTKYRRRALHKANAVHSQLDGDLVEACHDVKRTVEDVKSGAK
ncbi:AAA family ATPase [Gordonia defluvii]